METLEKLDFFPQAIAATQKVEDFLADYFFFLHNHHIPRLLDVPRTICNAAESVVRWTMWITCNGL